jgi:hypothetical protein
MPELIAMKLGMYIMPSEAISTAYFINPSITIPTLQPMITLG